MLRIDVSVDLSHPTGYAVPPTNPFVGQPGVLPEIWSFGLRNPWRFSFDDPTRGGTGALIIADVGQAGWEEVNYEPAGRGGRNYGWRNREGAHDNVLTLDPFSVPLTDPIYEYSHLVGRSITGGFVYRGNALGAGYVGRYFFADIISSRVWSLGLAIDGTGEASATDLHEHTAQLGDAARNVSTFGVDGNGELYLVSYGQGEIYRIALDGEPPAPPPTSCQTVQPGFDWVCANGNWYPPGMPIPGGPPDPPTIRRHPAAGSSDGSTGPPPPPRRRPSLPDGAARGRLGVCEWQLVSARDDHPRWATRAASTPATAGSERSTAAATAAGSADAISVPDRATGADWTCANGNWYPPGMAIPGGPPAPPPPPPPGEPGSTAAATPPVGSSCATPDPFTRSLDSGMRRMATGSAGRTGSRRRGTVRFQNLKGGFWAIEMDDGQHLRPVGRLSGGLRDRRAVV